MREWLRTRWDLLRSSYWFIPSLMALFIVALALTTLRLDEHYRDDALRELGWVYSGGAEGARSVLSTVAGSIITVAGTTFSVTIAALSLASGQFGPRLLRNFMRDTGNQVVLGTFTSTFLYSLLVLRTIRGLDENTYVPHISVTVGVTLAVFSVGVLIYFIHHIAESIQVGKVVDVVSGELHRAIERLFPERIAEPDEDSDFTEMPCGIVLPAKTNGYLQAIDEQTLINAAERSGTVVKLLCRPGDYLIPGRPLLEVAQPVSKKFEADIERAFTVGRVRTPHQDSAFAFLQLVEIAVRALSPGVNDPFTAIMCIDRITSAMVQLGKRSMPHPVRRDATGEVRLVAHPYSYDDLVAAGYRYIREAAKEQTTVKEHLGRQLQYVLLHVDNPAFRNAIRKEISALA